MTRMRAAAAAVVLAALGATAVVVQAGDDDRVPEPEAVCEEYKSPGGMDIVRTCVLP